VDNKKIAGATAASVNKVSFQLTTYDAEELAPEVAREPPIEYRREQELTISQTPFYDLLQHSHINPQIREFINTCLRYWRDQTVDIRERMQRIHIERMGHIDDASLARDMASIYGLMHNGKAQPMQSYIIFFGSNFIGVEFCVFI
jgi:hypothetical protein